jgi:type IV fimbrial biogenesis protein FimT
VRQLEPHNCWRSERGFTLPEVLIVIVLMGIVLAIASSSWFGVVESRRVDSAANQLVSDLRLAHTKSINQLATWRVVLNPDKADESAGADYSLVKLDSAGNSVAGSEIPRTLPDNVRLNSPTLLPVDGTRGIQFAADGSASAVGTLNLGVAGTDGCPASTPTTGPRIRVTVDNNPMHCITFNTTTSRIQID